jgi:hypothetical protein
MASVSVAPRPLSVAILAWLYVAVGVGGFILHARQSFTRNAFHGNDFLIEFTEVLAIVAGVFMLRACNWARWLALAWMAFHVAISFDAATKLAIHSLLLILFAWLLFRQPAAGYFRDRQAGQNPAN